MSKNLPSTYLKFWWYPRLLDMSKTINQLIQILVLTSVTQKVLKMASNFATTNHNNK